MTTLFKQVLSAMEYHNDTYGSEFSDWDDAQYAIDTYSENFNGECSDDEMQATIEALNLIIKTNGENRNKAIDMWNEKVWGQKFANSSGSVPYDG